MTYRNGPRHARRRPLLPEQREDLIHLALIVGAIGGALLVLVLTFAFGGP